MRYLWWPEFQMRGALHYHMILVDPPFEWEGEARRWFTDHWHAQLPPGVFRAQPDVQFRDGAWFRAHAGNYVLKDVRKLGGKHYQQDYTRMPRGWRTFRTHYLAFSAAEHQEHEPFYNTVCIAPPDANGYEKLHYIYVVGVVQHVPARGGCRLFMRRVRKRPPRHALSALPPPHSGYQVVQRRAVKSQSVAVPCPG